MVRLTDRLDMTIAVDWDIKSEYDHSKITNQTNKISIS